jgi:hypothetical protein
VEGVVVFGVLIFPGSVLTRSERRRLRELPVL